MSVRKGRSIYFARRNPVILTEEFEKVWKSHSDLLLTRPRLSEFYERWCYARVLHERIGSQDAGEPLSDGVGLFWMTDRNSWESLTKFTQRRAESDPEGIEIMRTDELRVFSRPVRDHSIRAEQIWEMGSPKGRFCLVLAVRGDHRDSANADVDAAIDLASDAFRWQTSAVGATASVAFEGTAPYWAVIEVWFDHDIDSLPGLTSSWPDEFDAFWTRIIHGFPTSSIVA